MSTPPEISQSLYERIECYLLNKMSEKELSEFEAERITNSSLRDEVEIQKDLFQAIEMGALRESLQKLELQLAYSTSQDEDITGKESPRYWFALAAGFAGLVALGVWMFIKPPEKKDLFAQYVEYDPGLPVPMSNTDDYHFYDAMVDYKNELYDKAISKWSVLLNEDPKNDTLNYYIGAAHFNLTDYKQAVPYFMRVHELNSLEFQAKSQWYLALSWLQTQNYSALDSLSNKALPPYRQRINELNTATKKGQ